MSEGTTTGDWHGIRRIVDEDTVWEVWEVHPRLEERRHLRDRRAVTRAAAGDRRTADHDLRVDATDAMGWLVFRSARDERRRGPIHAGWETMPASDLVAILHSARRTSPFPRVRG